MRDAILRSRDRAPARLSVGKMQRRNNPRNGQARKEKMSCRRVDRIIKPRPREMLQLAHRSRARPRASILSRKFIIRLNLFDAFRRENPLKRHKCPRAARAARAPAIARGPTLLNAIAQLAALEKKRLQRTRVMTPRHVTRPLWDPGYVTPAE